jgi:hypothetical protein
VNGGIRAESLRLEDYLGEHAAILFCGLVENCFASKLEMSTTIYLHPISQVLEELRRLMRYIEECTHEKLNYLGVGLSSRRNLCIHPEVAVEPIVGAVVDAKCRQLTASFVRNRQDGKSNCSFFNVSTRGADLVFLVLIASLQFSCAFKVVKTIFLFNEVLFILKHPLVYIRALSMGSEFIITFHLYPSCSPFSQIRFGDPAHHSSLSFILFSLFQMRL